MSNFHNPTRLQRDGAVMFVRCAAEILKHESLALQMILSTFYKQMVRPVLVFFKFFYVMSAVFKCRRMQ